MTVIAARVCASSHVEMAGDSRVNFGNEYVDGVKKVWACGSALVGFAGPTALSSVVESFHGLRVQATSDEIDEWCAALFDALRTRAIAHGQVYRQHDGTDSLDASFLVATLHGLWSINTDGAVLRIPRNWHAIGSGGAAARGALHVGVSAALAVEAACALDSGCGGPVTRLRLEPGGGPE